MSEAFVIVSEPVERWVWAKLVSQGAPVPSRQPRGTLYHWVADPDAREAWVVIELPDGTALCATRPYQEHELAEIEQLSADGRFISLRHERAQIILGALRNGRAA